MIEQALKFYMFKDVIPSKILVAVTVDNVGIEKIPF